MFLTAKVWADADPGFAIANTSGRRAPDGALSRHTPEPEGAATSLQILLDSRCSTRLAVAVVTRPRGTTIRAKSAAEALACAPTCAGRLVLDTQSKR